MNLLFTIHQCLILPFLLTFFGFYEKENFIADNIFEVKAGKSIMKISANGGRIISYSLGKNEFITSLKEHVNFGSTLWVAPQSDWGWPPYDALDNQEYVTTKIGDKVKMISKPDPISGLQFEKIWVPAGNQSIQIIYKIKNISRTAKRIGAWEVTRVPCGGVAFFPWGGSGSVPQSSLKKYVRKKNINWISIDKTPLHNHQKLFSTGKEGWLAYAFNGTLFVKQFQDTKYFQYSPNQGEIEIYLDKNKNYAELENHGSYQLLLSGQAISYKSTWYLANIPKGINTNIGNEKLATFCRNRINKYKH